MDKIISFENTNIARTFFKHKSEAYFQKVLAKFNLDKESVDKMDLEELKSAKLRLKDLSLSSKWLNENVLVYEKDVHFDILNTQNETDEEKRLNGFRFAIFYYLITPMSYIDGKIKELEQNKSVEIIERLVDEIKDESLKTKIENEINELKETTKRFDDHLKDDSKSRILYTEQIELNKSNVDIFGKKVQIWLKILDRESIASIIGSILLLCMGVCLLVMMFLQREPIKIVESAFLLILGYFFGHSKNNK